MMPMLRIPWKPLDERRKAHLRRWFYDLVDDYGAWLWIIPGAFFIYFVWLVIR